jgi:hypothetical protein
LLELKQPPRLRFAQPSPPSKGGELKTPKASQFEPQTYELAAPDGPLTYFGYVGYEHNGRLFSPAVTVNDLPGAIFFSTQSVMTLSLSNVFGTAADGMVLPSPSIE